MDKVSGIYAISSKCKPERVYIGSAVNIAKRWKEHRYGLKSGGHHSSKLQRHYNKYGADDLVYRLLLSCEKKSLIREEQTFIDLYKPYFNCCSIAGSQLGSKRSDEARNNMSKAQRGNNNCLGRRYSQETIQKMSKAHMGNKAWLGKSHSNETKEKLRNINKGKHHSNEVKAKISKGLIGNKNCGSALIINLETGIFYDSIINAAASVGRQAWWLSSRLTGKIKNMSMFRYVDEVDGNKNSK